MIWPALAAGTALFYALHGAWSTRVSRQVGALLGAWALFAFALPILGVYLALSGLPPVGPAFWPAWGAAALGNFAASYLFFAALRTGDLSLTYPLLALTPIFVPAVEWVLLRQIPAAGGFLGIGLVVAGVYLLNLRSVGAGVLAPFLALARDGSAVRALAVAVIWSVTGTLDRVAVLDSSPAFYAFMLSAAVAALLLPIALREAAAGHDRRRCGGFRSFPTRLSPAGKGGLMVHGALFACMLMLQMEALSLALASYVLSIKRAGTLVAVVLGWLAFRERALAERLLGTAVTLAGAFVLVIFG